MKILILISIVVASCISINANPVDKWYSFWNEDTSLIGYRDIYGNVMVEPKFGAVGSKVFENITAVTEIRIDKWQDYYLTKTGKIVGRDSMYYFDNEPDCENEGFIRFYDRQNDKVGVFNIDGKITIPAEYNSMSRVMNGFIICKKDAVKIHDDKEHYHWEGGKELIIDTNNIVIIENFNCSESLNLYNIERSDNQIKDSIHASYPAKCGGYISFIDYEKEFRQWLKNELLNDLSEDKIIDASSDTIEWGSSNKWSKSYKGKLIIENYQILEKIFLEIKQDKSEYFIVYDELNNELYDSKEFNKYFNCCGIHMDWKYPVMTIVVKHKADNEVLQNQLQFLRTENGYKMIGLVIRNEELKY